MGLDTGELQKALRLLLGAIESQAEVASVVLPARRYITTGGAVFDCEQVTVSGNGLATGFAGFPEAGAPIDNVQPGWYVDAELAIVRNASEVDPGGIPSVECIEADTDRADKDAVILTKAIESLAGPSYDQLGRVPVSVTFGEVQGGLTVVLLNASLNVWGI